MTPEPSGDYSYPDDDWGPPLDEDAPPLDEEPPADWEPPSGYGHGNPQPAASAPASQAPATQAPSASRTSTPAPATPSTATATATQSRAKSGNSPEDPWSRAVEQAPGTWVVGAESNVGRNPAQAAEEAAPATDTPDYEPAAAQVPEAPTGAYGHPTNAEQNPSSSWDVAPASSWPATESMPAPASMPAASNQQRPGTLAFLGDPARGSARFGGDAGGGRAVGQSEWPPKPVPEADQQSRSPSGPCSGTGEDPGKAGVGCGGHSQPGG